MGIRVFLSSASNSSPPAARSARYLLANLYGASSCRVILCWHNPVSIPRRGRRTTGKPSPFRNPCASLDIPVILSTTCRGKNRFVKYKFFFENFITSVIHFLNTLRFTSTYHILCNLVIYNPPSFHNLFIIIK